MPQPRFLASFVTEVLYEDTADVHITDPGWSPMVFTRPLLATDREKLLVLDMFNGETKAMYNSRISIPVDLYLDWLPVDLDQPDASRVSRHVISRGINSVSSVLMALPNTTSVKDRLVMWMNEWAAYDHLRRRILLKSR